MSKVLIYESLCRELDSLLIEIVDSCEEKIAATLESEKYLDHGFVNIAKTRFIRGSNTVSALQLPTEFSNPIEPVVTISRLQEGNKEVLLVNRKSLPTWQKTDNVRQRKANNEYNNKPLDETTLNDPIKLFGVLVPQTLKVAQKSFQNCIDNIGHLAESHSDLRKNMDRYSKLLSIKKQLSPV